MKIGAAGLLLGFVFVAFGEAEGGNSALLASTAQASPKSAVKPSAKSAQVEPHHMRWSDHDSVLANAVAWQEERDGHWVTVVLLTDRPVPPASIAADAAAAALMTEAKAQGVAFPVMTGGVPPSPLTFDVAYRDGEEINTASTSGAGGFEIETLTPTRIKGRTVMNAQTTGSRDANAWSVDFDAPVLRGDAARMVAEGESLGDSGGQPWKDFLAAQKAMREMDYKTISSYASKEMAEFLQDESKRERNLAFLKQMTAPSARLLGGIRNGSEATLYWLKENPSGLDSRCVETLVLQGERWRTTASACQGE